MAWQGVDLNMAWYVDPTAPGLISDDERYGICLPDLSTGKPYGVWYRPRPGNYYPLYLARYGEYHTYHTFQECISDVLWFDLWLQSGAPWYEVGIGNHNFGWAPIDLDLRRIVEKEIGVIYTMDNAQLYRDGKLCLTP